MSYVAAAIFHLTDGVVHDAWVVGDTQELWRSLGRASTPRFDPTAL